MNEKRTLYTTCDNCGVSIYEDDNYYYTHNDQYYCDSCGSDLIEYDGEYYEECECVYTRDDGYIPETYVWDYYSHCDDCGDWVSNDLVYWQGDNCYCDNCYDNHYGDLISGYHDIDGFTPYKLDKETNDALFVGFELETEPNNYHARLNRDMLETIIDNVHCHLEHDSSLDGDGFEIVTDPMTPGYLLQHRDNIRVMLDALIDNDYGTNGNAGLHVHVTRPQKNDTEIVRRIWLILENYKKEIIAISGRHSTGWAAFLSDNIRSNKKDDKIYNKCVLSSEYIKRDADTTGTRYLALNNTNYKTIEYRIFDHTTSIVELMARIELVINITRIASDLSIDLTSISFDDIINYNKDYNDLITYAYNSDVHNDKKIQDNTMLYRAYKKRIEDRRKAIEGDIKKLVTTFKASMIRNTNFNVNLKTNDVNYYMRTLTDIGNVLNELDRLSYQLDNASYNVYDYKYLLDNLRSYNTTPKYYKARINKLLDRIKGVL